MRASFIVFLIIALLSVAYAGPPPLPRPTAPPSGVPLDVPPSYRGGPLPSADDARSLGELGWWQIFQDPQLRKLIETSLQHNFDLRIAMARVEAAMANAGVTASNQSPQINVAGSMDVNEQSSKNPFFFPGLIPRTTSYGQLLLNLLSFELDVWGRLRHQTRAARAQLRASIEDRNAVMTTVVSQVAAAYFNLLALDAQLEVDRETLTTRRQALDIILDREQGGVATLLDVRQAQQLVLGAQRQVLDAERQIGQAENTINLLLGNPPGPVARGRSLIEQETYLAVPPGLPSSLLTRRPDILAAEANLIAQHELVESARAAFLPQITLTGNFGFQSVALTDLMTGAARTFTLLPQIAQPLINGGRLRSQANLAKANQKIALIAYQQTVQTAFREVSDALIEYQKTREARIVVEQLVETLADRKRLAYMRYAGGVDTYLNALDADRDLFTAQLGLADLRRNELLAVVTLYKALGGGWQAAAQPKSPKK